jgi:hypothetical protein
VSGDVTTPTATTLSQWERQFALRIQGIKSREPGCLLPAIPSHSTWDVFLQTLHAEWPAWRNRLNQYPSCLLMLYAGLAFYEYGDNTFWPHFAKSVGVTTLSAGEQTDINAMFSEAVESVGLGLKFRDNGTDFVGSAVQFIGIPLALWDGFLGLCEWALWRKDWKDLPGEEWEAIVAKRSGSRRRLKAFLTENRDATKALIQEMLDAREVLDKDMSLSVHDVANISFLRTEYFDEVPETADFLRPSNPESLFRDRARIVWNEARRELSAQLPGVTADQLPGTWALGSVSQQAALGPDTLVLNSEAFSNPLLLTLRTHNRSEAQRLRGVEPWGLFDTESGGRLANASRDELPLTSYVLVSRRNLSITLEGFDQGEGLLNEEFELSDGTKCFVSHLWPVSSIRALLRVHCEGESARTLRFRSRARIDARFFAGEGPYAACFARIQDFVKVERWPLLCVSVPRDYFRNAIVELNDHFGVFIDSNAAGGEWSPASSNDEREYFIWRWSSERPVRQQIGSGVVQSFRDLRNFFRTPSLRGARSLSVRSTEFTVNYQIFKDEPYRGMDRCWRNLPGDFLPMVLLSQAADGCKWDDLLVARDAIAPDVSLTYYQLKRLADYGYVEQRGSRWIIRESRACLTHVGGVVRLDYCGDVSNLWLLYRRLFHEMREAPIPAVEVVSERGSIPYLRATWPARLGPSIEKYLRHHGVTMGVVVWTL